jgi:hypothetical protein
VQGFDASLISATGAVQELITPATEYLRVRAFAQPALLVSIVAQSCLLAQRDSQAPAQSVLLQVCHCDVLIGSTTHALHVHGCASLLAVQASWQCKPPGSASASMQHSRDDHASHLPFTNVQLSM